MNIATIYTLYGRRAGAELCFEKIIESIYSYNKSVNWTIFCNKQAEYILKEQYPFTQTVYIPYLDNQYKKAFWLEFLSQKEVTSKDFDCFWIPSGCNHFPGHWYNPEGIFTLSKILVIPRDGDEPEKMIEEIPFLSERRDRILVSHEPRIYPDFSATKVRDSLKSGDGKWREFVPDEIVSDLEKISASEQDTSIV